MVNRSPCKDQICKPAIELLASKEIELTVEGTKVDNAMPPALQAKYARRVRKGRFFFILQK